MNETQRGVFGERIILPRRKQESSRKRMAGLGGGGGEHNDNKTMTGGGGVRQRAAGDGRQQKVLFWLAHDLQSTLYASCGQLSSPAAEVCLRVEHAYVARHARPGCRNRMHMSATEGLKS